MAVAVILLSIPGLYGSGPVQVQLKETVLVESGKVLLKDIANLEGKEPDLINKIGSLPIIDSPEFGEVKTLSRHQVDEILQRTRNAPPEIRICGAPIVQIRLKGRRIHAEEIVPVLTAFMMERTPWREHEIEIHSFKNLEEIEVPAEEFDLRISEKSPIFGNGRMLVSFDAFRDGKKLTSFWLAAGIRIKAEILAAAQRIPYGKVIAPEDVVIAVTDIEDPDTAIMRNADEAIGNTAKRSFYPGDPLTRETLMKPFLVNSGDTVHLRLEGNGIVLTALARAEQNGRLGQVIRVRNLEFSNVLKARVTGRAQVEIP